MCDGGEGEAGDWYVISLNDSVVIYPAYLSSICVDCYPCYLCVRE